MTIRFDIPTEVESGLRRRHGDPNRAAQEACLVEMYRQGELTHHQLAEALDLDRYGTDGLLKRHGVMIDLTCEELDRQLQSLRPGAAP